MQEVKLPQLGESVTEGTLGKWLKQVGEPVAKYEPLVEVITDKVNAEIPSDYEGILSEVLVREGDTVKVGTVICRIDTTESSGEPEATAPVLPTSSAPESTGTATAASTYSTAHGVPPSGGRFSPAVLRLAEEHGVDLSSIHGTGEGGRITRKDVLKVVEGGVSATPNPAGERIIPVSSQSGAELSKDNDPAVVDRTGVTLQTNDDEQVIQPSPLRKTIARRMVESKHNAPHAWMMVEADVTQLVLLREAAKVDFKRKEGVDLTFLPFFIKAVVEALKQYSMVNASWEDDVIRIKRRIDISIAVATDEALVVPVIHDADRLSIAGLAHAVNELAAKARSGKLTLSDVQGGTFTVNNTGAFGSILSQPIINAPQAAILSVESIVKRPVVIDDAIAIRSMVNLCLSLDHRVLDGWVAGQFMRAVKERLQTFNRDTALF